MMKKIYVTLLIGLLLIVTACTSGEQTKEKIAPFTFTNEEAKPFGSEDLYGSIWIANFIFTSCDTVCPQMTAELLRLQAVLADEGIEVTFVSFTVDPEVDRPKVIKEYMSSFGNEHKNWHMLTGYSQTEIETFAREQFQTIVQKPATSNQVIHGTNFYVVDQEGYLINEYNYSETAYIEKIIIDLKDIQK